MIDFARQILVSVFTILLLTSDAPAAQAIADHASVTQRTRPLSRLINDGWRFIRSDAADGEKVNFDDSSWDNVTLPHTWNAEDGSDGGKNYYRGPAWYRRMIDVQQSDLDLGRRFYLRFGAASLVARVYVNGEDLGEHRGGFAAFCFDATTKLHAGANVISVRVDNTRVDDIAPQSGDFTVFGGLYREVELLVLEPVHISPVDDASPGVYLKQADVSAASATVEVTTKLLNTTAIEEPNVTVSIEIVAREGESRAGGQTSVRIPGSGVADAVTRIVIDRPQLWNGVKGPNLYDATVTVRDSAGNVVDAVVQPLGLRTISVDSAKGLMLNGEEHPARGVNTHQEVPGKGWAGSREDYDESYALVREIGATAVRMAHYQHNDYEYTLCDESGQVVWAEIPLVDKFGPSPAFADNLKQQLRELIKQNYNHPSIVVWGLWNELVEKPEDPNWQTVRELNDLAHELDPTRPTTAAHHLKPEHPAVNIPDLIAFNRYAGWYGGDPIEWPFWIDDLEKATPGRRIALSEYGAGGSIVQHQLNPTKVKPFGEWHPEEYQSLVHEQAWHAMRDRKELWGTFVWNMFDFSVDSRDEGDHPGRNDKGLVTFDHKTRKDAFYYYQANWTAEPMVHITSARFDPYPSGPSTVKVYSNCDAVELIYNGKPLGKRAGVEGIFIWPDVEFREGPSTLLARGTKAGRTVTDEVKRTVSRSTRPVSTSPSTTQATTEPATEPGAEPATVPDP